MYFEKLPGYFLWLYVSNSVTTYLCPRKTFIENYHPSSNIEKIQNQEFRNKIRKAEYYTKLVKHK